MIRIKIYKACPSVQSKKISKNLEKWRKLICDFLKKENIFQDTLNFPKETIHQFVLRQLNGRLKLTSNFHLRKTDHRPDLDNMMNFILCCFKTDLTEEAREIERNVNFQPWFYYTAFQYPGEMDIWSSHEHLDLGAKEDLTEIVFEKFSCHV